MPTLCVSHRTPMFLALLKRTPQPQQRSATALAELSVVRRCPGSSEWHVTKISNWVTLWYPMRLGKSAPNSTCSKKNDSVSTLDVSFQLIVRAHFVRTSKVCYLVRRIPVSIRSRSRFRLLSNSKGKIETTFLAHMHCSIHGRYKLHPTFAYRNETLLKYFITVSHRNKELCAQVFISQLVC